MHVLSFWCCTIFALRPSNCISCIIQPRNTYEIHEKAAEICCKSVQNYEYIFDASWMNCAISGSGITCNLVGTRIGHRGRQTVCTSVRAGRGAPPVRNCVLFLVLVVTGRVQGPSQSQSQWLRLPGFRLQRQSQTGPYWLHEQSRFEMHVCKFAL